MKALLGIFQEYPAVGWLGLDIGLHCVLIVAVAEMRVKVGQLWAWRMEQIKQAEMKKGIGK